MRCARHRLRAHCESHFRIPLTSPALRRADPDDARAIAQVRIDAWRTTYRGMIPDAYLAAMNVDESEAMWRRVLAAGPNPASVFVAVDSANVVGFACGTCSASRSTASTPN
jgi:hypothetical protein